MRKRRHTVICSCICVCVCLAVTRIVARCMQFKHWNMHKCNAFLHINLPDFWDKAWFSSYSTICLPRWLFRAMWTPCSQWISLQLESFSCPKAIAKDDSRTRQNEAWSHEVTQLAWQRSDWPLYSHTHCVIRVYTHAPCTSYSSIHNAPRHQHLWYFYFISWMLESHTQWNVFMMTVSSEKVGKSMHAGMTTLFQVLNATCMLVCRVFFFLKLLP